MTLTPYIYHEFWAKSGDGDLVVGEVSAINDDSTDNHFADYFELSAIEEDVSPKWHITTSRY
ncbi:MAG: D-lyxose/D-mannose family sugar isomerase, partial [Fastidiosipila sp.]|nr:D-lyxose/D-mannose family sugar isomerase [Fastidiosipila sp.]